MNKAGEIDEEEATIAAKQQKADSELAYVPPETSLPNDRDGEENTNHADNKRAS